MMNLQLFAEGETGVEEGAAVPAEETKDPAKAFAARLGHEKSKMEAAYGPYKALIEDMAKESGMSPDEYLGWAKNQREQQALEAEADEKGKTIEEVRLEKEKAEADKRLARLERREKLTVEEAEMVKDPELGDFVSKHLKEIRELAEEADVDMDTALAVIAKKELKSLLKQSKPDYHKTAIIKDYLEGIKRGEKPLDIGGTGSVVVAQMPKTFEEAAANSRAMLRAQQGRSN